MDAITVPVSDIAKRRDRVDLATLYLLADHLDAVLSAGEDLLALGYTVPKYRGAVAGDALLADIEAEQAFVCRLKALEAALLSRVLQARVRAGELARADRRFKPITGMFVSGTHALVDAVDMLGGERRAELAFHGGGGTLDYYRSRGLLNAEAASLDLVDELRVTPEFAMFGVVMLGPLLDLAATFLDALELHYDLFEASDPTTPEPYVGEHVEAAAAPSL
jgi:hypothetical protein